MNLMNIDEGKAKRKSEIDLIAHVRRKSVGRYCLLNYISVSIFVYG